jgi:thiamine monophosphate synthase
MRVMRRLPPYTLITRSSARYTCRGQSQPVTESPELQVPVLAIGGVTVGRLAEIAVSGAAGIAAIDLFLSCEADLFQPDMRKILESVHEAFDTVRGVS